MILIDALHINDSGGKILLDYLIKSIEESDIKVTYISSDATDIPEGPAPMI